MANKKISELTAYTTSLDADLIAIVDVANNITKKQTKLNFLKEVKAAVVPSGVIAMWSGSIATIPTGWVFCDGNNGTPDLRNRFVICAEKDDGGVPKTTFPNGADYAQIGGGNTYHQHSTPAWYTYNDFYNDYGGRTAMYSIDGVTGYEYAAPAFYALAYIMKT